MSDGRLFDEWQYDQDNATVMCRCPKCEGRMIIDLYQYFNPYHYCPYCGIPLEEGKITAKRKQVYDLEGEDDGYKICMEMMRKYG